MVTKRTKKKTSKKTVRKVAGRKAPSQRKFPAWIILLFGILMGLLVAVYGYINGWVPKPDNPNETPVAQTAQTSSNSEVEDQSAELQIKPSNDFDFYESLQDMEVAVDKEALKQTQDRKPVIYNLQLGAFRKLSDAESLKAQVAFVGVTAHIQTITDAKGVQWHRVRIGPYENSRKADVAKRKLEDSGFSAILVHE